MNCNPGDLAVIYRSVGWGLEKAIGEACIGRYVVVQYLRKPIGDGNPLSDQVWNIERPFTVFVRGRSFEIVGVEDHVLRPIRDPGDDAQDETLQWLPMPEREGVAA